MHAQRSQPADFLLLGSRKAAGAQWFERWFSPYVIASAPAHVHLPAGEASAQVHREGLCFAGAHLCACPQVLRLALVQWNWLWFLIGLGYTSKLLTYLF